MGARGAGQLDVIVEDGADCVIYDSGTTNIDDDWGRRQNAEKALLKLGHEILPLLPGDTGRLSPEAK